MKKLAIYFVMLVLGVGSILGAAVGYGWYSEMAYTQVRQDSFERANHAMHEGDPDPSRHIIRPVGDEYYK